MTWLFSTCQHYPNLRWRVCLPTIHCALSCLEQLTCDCLVLSSILCQQEREFFGTTRVNRKYYRNFFIKFGCNGPLRFNCLHWLIFLFRYLCQFQNWWHWFVGSYIIAVTIPLHKTLDLFLFTGCCIQLWDCCRSLSLGRLWLTRQWMISISRITERPCRSCCNVKSYVVLF